VGSVAAGASVASGVSAVVVSSVVASSLLPHAAKLPITINITISNAKSFDTFFIITLPLSFFLHIPKFHF